MTSVRMMDAEKAIDLQARRHTRGMSMTGTGEFKFAVPDWRTVEPAVWLKFWAKVYESTPNGRQDNEAYQRLIDNADSLSPNDFETVGR